MALLSEHTPCAYDTPCRVQPVVACAWRARASLLTQSEYALEKGVTAVGTRRGPPGSDEEGVVALEKGVFALRDPFAGSK